MATLKDEEKDQGQGTSQALGQVAPQQEQQAGQAPQPQVGSSAPSRIGTSTAPVVKAMPKQQKAGTGTFANLKSYLQAAQSGGQQKVAQAATQQVQKLGAGAQKGIQQAQQTFGRQMEAGSLKDRETAAEEAGRLVGAARNVTYQAPEPATVQTPPQQEATGATPTTEPAVTPEVPPTATPMVETPQQYFSPEEQQRFAEIINAQYQGPQSIQQAGLYEQAAQKARTAQQAAERTQTALGREQLLKDVFGRGRDYSRGASKLDALLLNTAQQGVGELQKQGEEAGAMQQRLQQAQTESTNLATGRARDISNIQQEARRSFLEGRTAEETGTETRIDKLIKEPVKDASGNPIPKLGMDGKPIVDAEGKPVYQTQWDQLPEYFRDVVRNREANNQKELDRKVAEYTAKTPQVPQEQLSAAQKQLDLAKNKLKKLDRSSSPSDTRLVPAARQELKIAKESFNTLSAQKTAYDAGLSKIKQETNLKALNLSPEEAAILGVSSGEGIYNELPNLIQNVNAERSRLVTKDEAARQQALARLAGLDISNQLQKDLMYTDMDKAGTQTLQSSLNTEAIRNLLNQAQEGFKESAESKTLRGEGEKKVSRGNWLGKKTDTYRAAIEGNAADMLRQAGYDVSSMEPSQTRSLLTNKDLLDKYLAATSTSRDYEANIGGKTLEGAGTGAATGASIGSFAGGIGAGPGAAIGATVGALAGSNTLDPLQMESDLLKELEQKLGIKGLGAVGQGVQDIRGAAASPLTGIANIAGSNVVGDIFRGLAGAVGGIDTGAMKAYGDAIAKQQALADLQGKYRNYLTEQGFENRTNIANTQESAARSAALQSLLRRQG